jgi:hypothetical protein
MMDMICIGQFIGIYGLLRDYLIILELFHWEETGYPMTSIA